MDLLKDLISCLEFDVACLLDEGGRVKKRDLYRMQDKLSEAADIVESEGRGRACFFLIADISRICRAEVTAVSGDGGIVCMNAENWPAEVIICADRKRVDYPASLPRDQYLMIQGAATCGGYKVFEYWDKSED